MLYYYPDASSPVYNKYLVKTLNSVQVSPPPPLYLIKEFLLCIDKHVFLFGSSSCGWDALGLFSTGLADNQAVVAPPTGLICPLSFSDFFPKGP